MRHLFKGGIGISNNPKNPDNPKNPRINLIEMSTGTVSTEAYGIIRTFTGGITGGMGLIGLLTNNPVHFYMC